MNWRRYLPFVADHPPAPKCQHKTNDIWPSTDASIWYLKSESYSDDTRWCEKDAVYIKLRDVTRTFVCEGCGEIKTIHTAEKEGGEDGIRLKDSMTLTQLRQFKENTESGGFYNGWDFYSREYLYKGKHFHIPLESTRDDSDSLHYPDDNPGVLSEFFNSKPTVGRVFVESVGVFLVMAIITLISTKAIFSGPSMSMEIMIAEIVSTTCAIAFGHERAGWT